MTQFDYMVEYLCGYHRDISTLQSCEFVENMLISNDIVDQHLHIKQVTYEPRD